MIVLICINSFSPYGNSIKSFSLLSDVVITPPCAYTAVKRNDPEPRPYVISADGNTDPLTVIVFVPLLIIVDTFNVDVANIFVFNVLIFEENAFKVDVAIDETYMALLGTNLPPVDVIST
jgi:hypothetical protein